MPEAAVSHHSIPPNGLPNSSHTGHLIVELQTSQERQTTAHQQEIEQLQTLHKAAVARAVHDEEQRRLEAERLCATQAQELREIGKTMFIQIKSECDAVRLEYDERLRTAETREREAQDTLSSMVVRRTKSTAKASTVKHVFASC